MAVIALLVLGLTIGYHAGRIRPLRSARDITEGWIRWGWPKWMPLWLVALFWAVLHPLRAQHAWRHRHDPPKPREVATVVFKVRDVSDPQSSEPAS